MRHRIHVPDLAGDAITITIAGDELHHAVRVVRVREGEEVELFDGRGHAVRGVVETIDKSAAVVRVVAPIPSRESSVPLHLAMAIIQLEKFELVLQKATELGVASIIPLITERIELRAERYRGKAERWQRIVLEAVKQSGRAVVPIMEEPSELAAILVRPGTKILFDADAPPTHPPTPTPATLLIGPEGGWTDEELALAREHGCTFERLGPRRLRAETAAIVACAIVAARCGDL